MADLGVSSGDQKGTPSYQSSEAAALHETQLPPVDTTDTDADVSKEEHYTYYLDPAFPIEERIQGAFHELKITPEQQEKILGLLAPLKVKHPPTYEHTLRVGLLARKIASFLQLNEKAAFYAGALHDAGKSLTAMETLDKTSGWTAEDQAEVERHVVDGVRLLGGSLDFTADTTKYHHHFQRGGYPTELPPDLHEYSEGTRLLLQEYGRIVAIADTFDAMHRINEKHGEKRPLPGDEIKTLMLKAHQDRAEVIEALFHHGILTTFIVGEPNAETDELDANDELYDSSFEHTDTVRSTRNTRRHLQIAAALEPLSDKAGATTRYQDCSRHLKLEYFTVAAINIGDAFSEMAQEIQGSDTAPENLYRFAARAQLESKRNRRGGRVNHGIIELLAPIVAAQHLHDTDYQLGGNEILTLAADFIANTTRADVESLRQLKQTAYTLSHYHDREVLEHSQAQNVRGYYEAEREVSQSATSKAHNAEFLSGFPTVSMMYRTLTESPYPHFSQRIEEAFHRVRAMHDPEVSVGFLADCAAVAIYLSLSQDPTNRLVG